MNNVDKLNLFIDKDKFANHVWHERGLNPSSPNLCKTLSLLLNQVADNLKTIILNNSANFKLKDSLVNGLSSFNALSLDTEEKELICDYFYDLSVIIKVDFGDEVSKWLYGSEVAELIKKGKSETPVTYDKIIVTQCVSCGGDLKTLVKKRREGIPGVWLIVKCKNCGDYNLLFSEPGVSEFDLEGYVVKEQYISSDHTEEQVKKRLAFLCQI